MKHVVFMKELSFPGFSIFLFVAGVGVLVVVGGGLLECVEWQEMLPVS